MISVSPMDWACSTGPNCPTAETDRLPAPPPYGVAARGLTIPEVGTKRKAFVCARDITATVFSVQSLETEARHGGSHTLFGRYARRYSFYELKILRVVNLLRASHHQHTARAAYSNTTCQLDQGKGGQNCRHNSPFGRCHRGTWSRCREGSTPAAAIESTESGGSRQAPFESLGKPIRPKPLGESTETRAV